MVENIEKVVDELVNVLQTDCLAKTKTLKELYLEIKAVIEHIPTNLEEVEEIQDFLKVFFNGKLEFIESEVEKLMQNIDILEGY